MDISNTRFRPHIDVKDQGSITLGFLDASLDFDEHSVEISDMCVRLTTDGRPAVSFPTRPWKDRDGNTRYASIVRLDEESYALLVEKVFAIPKVLRTVDRAELERAA